MIDRQICILEIEQFERHESLFFHLTLIVDTGHQSDNLDMPKFTTVKQATKAAAQRETTPLLPKTPPSTTEKITILLYEYRDLLIDMNMRNNRSELAIANRHQER